MKDNNERERSDSAHLLAPLDLQVAMFFSPSDFHLYRQLSSASAKSVFWVLAVMRLLVLSSNFESLYSLVVSFASL